MLFSKPRNTSDNEKNFYTNITYMYCEYVHMDGGGGSRKFKNKNKKHIRAQEGQRRT